MNFEKGDIVTLKSGGPKMTLSKFGKNLMHGTENRDEVHCSWFEGTELKKAKFEATSLEKVE